MSGTSSDNRPGSFAKTHARPAPCALRNTPVYYYKTNRLFAEIIRWTYIISLQKQEAAFINTVNKSCPIWPPIFRFFFLLFVGCGLMMSDDGGLDELEEFFSSRAIFSLSIVFSA
jgi:hypothetical protein